MQWMFGFSYRWRATIGTCSDGSIYKILAWASIRTQGEQTCEASYYLYQEGVSSCYAGSLYPLATMEWSGTISVGTVISMIASIGGGGDPLGVWCNGYGDASIAFEICKPKNNIGPYDGGGYFYPGFCCASKGTSELLCSLNLNDVVYYSNEGSVPHQRTALLSELEMVSLQWAVYSYSYNAYMATIPIRTYVECLYENNPACDYYGLPYYTEGVCSLRIVWAPSQFADHVGSGLSVHDPNSNDGPWFGLGAISPTLPDCNSAEYVGAVGTSNVGTITGEEAVYCDIYD